MKGIPMNGVKKETLWSTIALLAVSASYVAGWATARSAPPAPANLAAAGQAAAAENGARVSALTKMIYEYYYADDGVTETAEESAPAFLVAKTREELKAMFADWDVVGFSAEEVVMRKTVAGASPERFVVKEHEGFVAVFYETDTGGELLREITETPVSALPETARERLRAGIRVTGEEALAKILQDYGS
jgi:hypothetical protein